jgi:DinB superfamily
MMPHPLVARLRFTRDEFVRGLTGLTDEEARRRFLPINSIGWMIGHLAWQEQRNWLTRAQGQILRADLNECVANGKPASMPPLEEMYTALNFAGAALAGYASYLIGFVPFVILEGTWAAVAAVALGRRVLGVGRAA